MAFLHTVSSRSHGNPTKQLGAKTKIVLVSVLQLKLIGQSSSNHSSVIDVYHTRITKQGSGG